jgi:hypothetical protein
MHKMVREQSKNERGKQVVIDREQGLNPGATAFPAEPPLVSLRLASDWQGVEFR